MTPDGHQEIRPGIAAAAGRWKLIFDRVGAWHIDPDNGGVVNQYTARSSVIDVFAPISDGAEGRRRQQVRGPWVWAATATTSRTLRRLRIVRVRPDERTLKAKKEGCPNRRAIWEGICTRAH